MNVLDTAWAEKRIADAFLYDRIFKVAVRIGDLFGDGADTVRVPQPTGHGGRV
jgi:hypothetical protein